MSLGSNEAVSEIYTRGKHLNVFECHFDVNKKFFRREVWREMSFQTISVNHKNNENLNICYLTENDFLILDDEKKINNDINFLRG